MELKNVATLPEELRTRIKTLCEAKGIYATAKILGISKHAMDRAAGGLSIHKGTAAFLAQQIAARDAEGKNP